MLRHDESVIHVLVRRCSAVCSANELRVIYIFASGALIVSPVVPAFHQCLRRRSRCLVIVSRVCGASVSLVLVLSLTVSGHLLTCLVLCCRLDALVVPLCLPSLHTEESYLCGRSAMGSMLFSVVLVMIRLATLIECLRETTLGE